MAKNKTSFQAGNPGRQPNTPNKLTKTVKETVLNVFNDLQSDETNNLKSFAEKYPRDFYQIAARLIPTEINAKISKVSLEIVRTITTSPKHTSSSPAKSD